MAFGFKKVDIYKRSDENAQDHSTSESIMLEYINCALGKIFCIATKNIVAFPKNNASAV